MLGRVLLELGGVKPALAPGSIIGLPDAKNEGMAAWYSSPTRIEADRCVTCIHLDGLPSWKGSVSSSLSENIPLDADPSSSIHPSGSESKMWVEMCVQNVCVCVCVCPRQKERKQSQQHSFRERDASFIELISPLRLMKSTHSINSFSEGRPYHS